MSETTQSQSQNRVSVRQLAILKELNAEAEPPLICKKRGEGLSRYLGSHQF